MLVDTSCCDVMWCRSGCRFTTQCSVNYIVIRGMRCEWMLLILCLNLLLGSGVGRCQNLKMLRTAITGLYHSYLSILQTCQSLLCTAVMTESASMCVHPLECRGNYTGWVKKLDCFWDQITLHWLVIERCVIRRKFQNFVQNEMRNLQVSAVKYSLPSLHKSSIPPTFIEFDNDAWVLLNFYSKYSKTRTISNTYG